MFRNGLDLKAPGLWMFGLSMLLQAGALFGATQTYPFFLSVCHWLSYLFMQAPGKLTGVAGCGWPAGWCWWDMQVCGGCIRGCLEWPGKALRVLP